MTPVEQAAHAKSRPGTHAEQVKLAVAFLAGADWLRNRLVHNVDQQRQSDSNPRLEIEVRP